MNHQCVRLWAVAVVLSTVLVACSSQEVQSPEPSGDGDAELHSLVEEFLRGYFAWRPQAAVGLGFHEHDGKMTDLSLGSIEAERNRLRFFERRFGELSSKKLSREFEIDLKVLLAGIRGELFRFEDQEAYTKNPMTYAGALDVNIYIKRDFAPLADRVRFIVAMEERAPAIVQAAKANLQPSLARPFVETAIDMAKGSADFLERDLARAVSELKDVELLARFGKANALAVESMRGYAEWLEKEKLPTSTQDFALGRQKFARMLREQELIDVEPEDLLKRGLSELKKQQQILVEAAKIVDPSRPPMEVFKATQHEHPAGAELIPHVRKSLEAIRQFLVDHKIVTLPSEVRARVAETPQYLRATSFASMDTPGPFETRATEAYYYVTPVEPEWTPAQQEEWLTAFNYYATDVISIHEAYPGHYAQFLCLNASKASRVRKIFNSYAFVEGWAHYTEQMMLEEGFGAGDGAKPEDRVRAAKYRLGQSVEALLRLCRWCVAIQMHCGGMSVDEATRFLQTNCYYEEKPARQEAIRGTFDPGYLFYSVGKLQILKLREDYKRQEGSTFTLQRFHDELLRHGAPPIRLLREILLKSPEGSEM